ncbi:uncharacterized protein AB675_3804 [Cyphellophora attinorum]|uniref:Large ribosomal subunit protein mL49 n=1 Tax=Cyphellophora attinorum TaxID=1664694 RepID=A0A0N0NI23_9EURO|nr:uncharacterized protein AB675_3804 [Phialophora attinorum]KPI35228.1 hypothetical protein AB675_3804 [Phialophora attinorum]
MPPKAPSLALLQVFSPALRHDFLVPQSISPQCVRTIRNTAARVRKKAEHIGWMPREKYAKITSLDKLHRRQRDQRVQQRLDSQQRATGMIFAPTPIARSPMSTAAAPVPESPTAAPAADALFSSTSTSTPAPTPTPTPTSPETTAPFQPNPGPTPTTLPFKLPYLITRTKSLNLPVYEQTKGGGTSQLTIIRKITGDIPTFQRHIHQALFPSESEDFKDKRGRKKKWVSLNENTGHVVVRGWRGAEVKRWLELGGF